MDSREIESRVLSTASRVLGVQVSLEHSRDNLANWDSLANVDLIFSLEEEFLIQFPSDTLERLTSIQAIVGALRSLNAS